MKRPNMNVNEVSTRKVENTDPETIIREATSTGMVDVIRSLNPGQKETLDIAITSFLAGVNAAIAATRTPA